MAEPLFAILDETGTTSRPMVASDSNFAFGGLIAEQSQLQRLTDISRQISKVVGEEDYKYRHVQRSTEARTLFLRAMNGLTIPAGGLAMYAVGGSLQQERLRTQQAFTAASGEGTAFADEANKLLKNDGTLHLTSFLSYFAPVFVKYAEKLARPIHIYWDQRNDLTAIQKFCEEQGKIHTGPRNLGICPVDFSQVAETQFLEISRLAGALAGDVRCFFIRHGERIWKRLQQQGHGDQNFLQTATAVDINLVYPLTRIATVNERLADADFGTGSRDTCILQGYSKRFIQNAISFAAPTGIMGHIMIDNGSRWHIQQIPD